MRLTKKIANLSRPSVMHSTRVRFCYSADMANSDLDRLGSYDEVMKMSNSRFYNGDIGFYADEDGHETLNGAVYGYGRRHVPTGDGTLYWDGEYYGWIAIVESSDTDTVYVIDEKFETVEDAADAGHALAELLAESEREYSRVGNDADRCRMQLREANDEIREAFKIIRQLRSERLDMSGTPVADRVQKMIDAGCDARDKAFADIAESRPSSGYEGGQLADHWREMWNEAGAG